MEDHSMLRLCFATKTSMKPGKPSLLGKKRNDEGFPGVIAVFFWQNEALTFSSMKIQALKLVIKRQNNEGFPGFIDVFVAAKCI